MCPPGLKDVATSAMKLHLPNAGHQTLLQADFPWRSHTDSRAWHPPLFGLAHHPAHRLRSGRSLHLQWQGVPEGRVYRLPGSCNSHTCTAVFPEYRSDYLSPGHPWTGAGSASMGNN